MKHAIIAENAFSFKSYTVSYQHTTPHSLCRKKIIMPGTKIVLNANEPDPDPGPFLFLSAEHKAKNAAKPYDPKRSCWAPCKDNCWVEGLIMETAGAKVKVELKADKSVLNEFFLNPKLIFALICRQKL